ncbi:unnamed protein product [Anisakis simplex]|uniref:Chitin-binding type-2 domain-containing protein n=1 Tax=Anisakis simplex TaxID=6269 RepID=A0A3P6NXH4_ANISI|nr:unnamed protein product [Anisakis simplex]
MKLPDGIYGVGCSRWVLVCVIGETRYVSCSKDRVYDEVTKKCLLPWFVRACRNWRASTTAESHDLWNQDTAEHPDTEVDVPLPCNGKADGFDQLEGSDEQNTTIDMPPTRSFIG